MERPKAYSYLRFSTPEQMRGDSYRRQYSQAAEYAAKHGLDLDDELTFEDLGVSAFRGKNAEAGRLADFLTLVEMGRVPQGSYLLVESLDRVSRTTPRKAVRILERICEAGINVVTLSDGKVYNEEILDNDGGMSLIMSVLIFIRANEESQMKSRRVREVWAAKRKQLVETEDPSAYIGKYPSWLRRRDDGTFEVIEEKAEVVRRIYTMIASGHGTIRISRILNEEGIPPFGRGKKWHPSSVAAILNNRAAIGEYQPRVIEYVDGLRKSRIVGKPVSIYPPIISRELYDSVQAIRETRDFAREAKEVLSRRPRAGRRLINVFAGLSVCALCGTAMVSTKVTRKSGRRVIYLVCYAAKFSHGCRYLLARYDHLIQTFMDNLDRLLEQPEPDSKTQEELESLEAPISALEDTLKSLVSAYERVPDPVILDRITEVRSELTVLRERERSLRALLANIDAPTVQMRINALREALGEDPWDVQKVNGCLRTLFSGLSINPLTGTATLAWRGGGTVEWAYSMPREEYSRKGA